MSLVDLFPNELWDEIFQRIPSDEYYNLSNVCEKFKQLLENKPTSINDVILRINNVSGCVFCPKKNKILTWKIPKYMHFVHHISNTGLFDPKGWHVGIRIIRGTRKCNIDPQDFKSLDIIIDKKRFHSITHVSAYFGWYEYMKYSYKYEKQVVSLDEIYDDILKMKSSLCANYIRNKIEKYSDEFIYNKI